MSKGKKGFGDSGTWDTGFRRSEAPTIQPDSDLDEERIVTEEEERISLDASYEPLPGWSEAPVSAEVPADVPSKGRAHRATLATLTALSMECLAAVASLRAKQVFNRPSDADAVDKHLAEIDRLFYRLKHHRR